MKTLALPEENSMLFSSLLKDSGTTDSWGDYLPNTSDSGAAASCWLNQFSALKVFGPDAERFLQGQLTCNINELNTDTVVYGACCNAKGRTVANFNISFDGENYWLVLPTESALVLEKHLQKYKVFFKATIENCQQSHLIFGQWVEGEAHQASHNNATHHLQISVQRRFVICTNEAAQENAELSKLVPTLNWRLADIDDGIYYVSADQTEVWIPQHINLHQTGGISFGKGCYTGQEIIARLQYLGKAKKALYHYRSDKNLTDTTELASFVQNTDSKSQSLFNAAGKSMGQILFSRSQPNPANGPSDIQLDVLAVLNTDSPDEVLYLTESANTPLTLQNISYTEKKTV